MKVFFFQLEVFCTDFVSDRVFICTGQGGGEAVWALSKNPLVAHLQVLYVCFFLAVLVLYCCKTNYHKLSDLKQHYVYSFIILEVKSLKWVHKVAFLLEVLGENSFLYIFQFLEVFIISWFTYPFLKFRISNG